MIAFIDLGLRGKQAEMFTIATNEKSQDNKLKEVKAALNKKQEIESGKIYENAFEWRFEFPEVLNEQGDFVGFDVVIGNPPYGVSIKNIELRNYLIEQFGKVSDYEIYYMFINLGLKLIASNGQTSLLIPNTLLFNVYANNFRLNMLDKLDIVEVLDFTAWQLFEDATVKNIVLTVKNTLGNKLGFKNTNDCEDLVEYISRPTFQLNYEVVRSNNANWGLLFKLKKNVLDLIEKIRKDRISLNDYFPELSQGLIAYDSYRGQTKEFIENRPLHSTTRTELANKSWINGEDVKPYQVSWNKKDFFEYSDRVGNKRQSKFFSGKRVLVREITNPRIFCGYTDTELYHDPAIIVILESIKFNLYVLLAILNSELATYYHFNSSPKATKGAFPKFLVKDISDFPLPKFVSSEDERLVIDKVNAIITAKQHNTDTSQLEADVDAMVYALYGLSDDEIKLIAGLA
ncbi:MAG: Eco57I restriction-modification methylase domain-containing protein [Pedobacter sp.]|nr:Eco57I restriction-modification methylase domain-containing protein [Pedobacter sp.]